MRRTLLPLVLLLLAVPQQTAASALGQLESLTGQKVNTVKVPMPSRPSPVGSARALSGAAAAGKASSSLGALSMGLQLLDLLDAMDSPAAVDNSQILQQQQRQEQERLQQLRQQSAEQLRSSWDRADADHAASLSGVLDVPVQSGTAFFGTAPNPNQGLLAGQPAPGPATPSVTTQAPATATKTIRQTQSYIASVAASLQMTPELPPAHTEILTKGYQEYSREFAKDLLKDGFEKALALLPNQWKTELIYEHKEKMGKFIDEIFTTLDPQRLVNTIVNGTPAEMAQLERLINRETTDSARRLGFGETILDEDEPKFLLKLGRGEKVSAGEAWQLVKGRIHSTLVDKTSDRLLFGGD